MSVYTPLSEAQLSHILSAAGFSLLSAKPALHGIENTNYLLQAQDQQQQPCALVLTVLEDISAQHVPWFVTLLNRCHDQGLPVPNPVCPPLTVADKPALLVPLLPGSHPDNTSTAQCHAIGDALAKLHVCELASLEQAADATALSKLEAALTLLPEDHQDSASKVLNQWQQLTLQPVLIHGDLFRDNALFEGDKLTGLLDFYAAGQGPAIFDIAVAMNDWCVTDGQFCPEKEQALLSGYQQQRPLTAIELQALPLALSAAALRFWLSRLVAEQRHHDQQLPDSVSRKDPAEFEHKYSARLNGLA